MGLCQVISVQRQKKNKKRQTALLGWGKKKTEQQKTPRLLKSDVSCFHCKLTFNRTCGTDSCTIILSPTCEVTPRSNSNASFFSQPWKLRGSLQFSPLWWRCAPSRCVWCLPSAGHPRRCAPTPTRGPSSWPDRRSTPPPCCCSPWSPQVIPQWCVSIQLLHTSSPQPHASCVCIFFLCQSGMFFQPQNVLFLLKYNLLFNNGVARTLDSDAVPGPGFRTV